MTALEDRSIESWASLCKNVKELVPPQIGKNAWELIIAAALIAAPDSQLLAHFYTYLIQQDPDFKSEEQQKRLQVRLRDTLLKLTTLVGAPQVLCALGPLAKAEGKVKEKAQASTLNPKWRDVDAVSIHARGMQTVDAIYGPLLPKIFGSWGNHTQDMQFNTVFSVYGLYLSDFEVMTALETEAIVFTTISCTGLRSPSLWHMRGMGRRLGARGTNEESEEMRKIKDSLRALKTAMMTIIEWVGDEYVRRANLGAWVNVGDIVRELDGWGDDEQDSSMLSTTQI